jgi:hypothetical protein
VPVHGVSFLRPGSGLGLLPFRILRNVGPSDDRTYLAAGAELGLVKIEADNLAGPADECRDGSGPIGIDQDPGLLGGAL